MLEGGGIPTYETSPGSLIQCHLYPVIPWRVAPQQSPPPFHRMGRYYKFREDLISPPSRDLWEATSGSTSEKTVEGIAEALKM